MSSFPISITWQVSTPPVGGFNQLAQAAQNLDAALQTSGQKLDQFASAVDQIDKPLQSAGQGMGELGDNMDGLDSALDSSAGAMGDLGEATDDMSDSMEGVGDSVGDAAGGFEELNDGAENAQNSLGEVSDSIESASQGLGEMSTGLEETGTGFETMNTSVEASNTGLADMTTAVEDTTTGLTDMATGTEETTTGIEDLASGVEDSSTGFDDFGSSISDATSGLEGFDEGIGDTDAGVSVLSGSFDDASTSTEGFSGALGNVGNELAPVNGGLTQGNLLTTNLAGSTKVLGGNMTNLGIGMAGVSGAAIGLFNAYDNIGDAAVGVEVAQGALIRTQARAETSINNLDKAMEDLNKRYGTQIEGIGPLNEAYAEWKSLVDQNITSGEAYDKALQNLKAAQEAANGTTRDSEQALAALGGKIGMTEAAIIRQVGAENTLANAQEMLNQMYLQSATSIIPSVILGLTGMRDMVTSVKDIVKATPAAFTAFVGILKGLPAMFTAIGSAISTSMLPALAAIAVPAGIAVLAIGAVVAAIMAIRTTIPIWDQMGMAIGNAIPQSVGFLNDLRAAFISTSDAVNSSISFMLGGLDQLTGGSLKLKEGFDKWVSTLPEASSKTTKLGGDIRVLDTGVNGLNATLVMQKGTFQEYNGNLKDMDNNMIALAGNWHKNAQGAAVVTKAYGDNSSAAGQSASIQAELNASLKPYVPLALDAASGTEANAQASDAASMSQAALQAAIEGDTSALVQYIQNATGGAVSSEDLGAGADVAATGMEGITPAATDAGAATMTFDQALQQAAQSTDPLVAGLAQAEIELRNQTKEADIAFVKNTRLLKVWGVEIPAAIANDVNAIQALVNISADEHSAMDETIIKADEVILKYGDIGKAADMTRAQKLAYAKQLEDNIKKTEDEAASMEDSIPIHEQVATKIEELNQKRKDEQVELEATRQANIQYIQSQTDWIVSANESIQVAEALVQAIDKLSVAYEEGRASIVSWAAELLAAQEKERGALDMLQPLIGALATEFPAALNMSSEEIMRLSERLLESGQGWEDWKNKIKEAIDEVAASFEESTGLMEEAFQRVGEAIGGDEWKDDLSEWEDDLDNTLSGMTIAVDDTFGTKIPDILAQFNGDAQSQFSAITGYLSDLKGQIDLSPVAWDAAFGEIEGILNDGRLTVNEKMALIEADIAGLWERAKPKLLAGAGIMTDAMENFITSDMLPAIESALGSKDPTASLLAWFEKLPAETKDQMSLFTGILKSAGGDVNKAITTIVGYLQSKDIKIPESTINAMATAFNVPASTIKSKIAEITGNIQEVPKGAQGASDKMPQALSGMSLAMQAEKDAMIAVGMDAVWDAFEQDLATHGLNMARIYQGMNLSLQAMFTIMVTDMANFADTFLPAWVVRIGERLTEQATQWQTWVATSLQHMIPFEQALGLFSTDFMSKWAEDILNNGILPTIDHFGTFVLESLAHLIPFEQALDEFANMFMATWAEDIKTNVVAAANGFAAFVTGSLGHLIPFEKALGEFATTFLSKWAADVSNSVGQAARGFATFASGARTAISSVVSDLAKFGDSFMPAAAASVQSSTQKMVSSFASFSSQARSHVSSFSSAFSSAMSKVTSDASRATSAVKSLQSAINSLKSKSITITVTTVYRTVYAAGGGAFIASSPTKIGPLRASEFGQKELVTVTPLEGPGRNAIKGLSEAMGGPRRDTDRKGRRLLAQEAEGEQGARGRGGKEMVMMRETPIIIQIDGREITRVVNKRMFEESDALV